MRLAVVAVLWLLSGYAAAQDRPGPPQWLFGIDRIKVLAQGDAAPWEGLLLDVPTATRWTLREEWYRRRLELDAELFTNTWARLDAIHADTRKALEASYAKENAALRNDLREQAKALAKPTPFWRTAAFGLCSGVVLSAVVAVAAVVATN